MKHGSGSEGEHLHSTSSISPCSPGLPQLWEVSMANKGAPMHPNNYMNSFGHWYPNHHPHQDAMPRPQMMWVGGFLVPCRPGARAYFKRTSDYTELPSRPLLRTVSMCLNVCLIELWCISCAFWLPFSLQKKFDQASDIFFRFVIMSLQLLVQLTEMWTVQFN